MRRTLVTLVIGSGLLLPTSAWSAAPPRPGPPPLRMVATDLDALVPEAPAAEPLVTSVATSATGSIRQVVVWPGQKWSGLSEMLAGHGAVEVRRGAGRLVFGDRTEELRAGLLLLLRELPDAVVDVRGEGPLVLLVHVPQAAGRAAGPSAAVLEAAKLGSIKRVHAIDGFFLAGAVAKPDLEAAQRAGVVSVIDMLPVAEHGDFDEAAAVRELGMAYENPGWNGPQQLTDELIDHSRELLRSAKRPVLVHCASANRVGAIWLAYRVLDDGVAYEAALQEAKTIGLRTPAYEPIVRDYVERMRSAQGAETDLARIEAQRGSLSAVAYNVALEALADERRAESFYAAVIDRFGAKPPFSRVIGAERRHQQHLVDVLEGHGAVVPPKDPA
ncbi:MAG: hypothetical protein KDA22_12115, partial [Phycisphaerales bacterium]|nr:hypothetical protein [Phycisphaerales bacterium]